MATLVKVTWKDAYSPSSGSWITREDLKPNADLTCETVGFLVNKTEDRLIIVGSKFIDGSLYGDVTHIPLGMVAEVAQLTPHD